MAPSTRPIPLPQLYAFRLGVRLEQLWLLLDWISKPVHRSERSRVPRTLSKLTAAFEAVANMIADSEDLRTAGQAVINEADRLLKTEDPDASASVLPILEAAKGRVEQHVPARSREIPKARKWFRLGMEIVHVRMDWQLPMPGSYRWDDRARVEQAAKEVGIDVDTVFQWHLLSIMHGSAYLYPVEYWPWHVIDYSLEELLRENGEPSPEKAIAIETVGSSSGDSLTDDISPRSETLPVTSGMITSGSRGNADGPKCSNDFKTVHWNGWHFKFSPKQMKVFELLLEAWEAGPSELSWEHIKERIKSKCDSLLSLFKQKGKRHPAVYVMIVKGETKDGWRLQEPPPKPDKNN